MSQGFFEILSAPDAPGRMLDFEITVIEDRKEFADRALQAGARHVICRSYADALAEIEGDAATAFVIVTRAHTHDLECLRLILGKPFGYAGMMGAVTGPG